MTPPLGTMESDEEVFQVHNDGNEVINNTLGLPVVVVERYIAVRDDKQIKYCEDQIFWMKIVIFQMILYLYFLTKEVSVKDRKWFGDNGVEVYPDIVFSIVSVNILLLWWYWSWDSATRWYDGAN